MSLIIKDDEMIRAGRLISTTMEEIVELSDKFSEAINRLTEKGISDKLIADALLEKTETLSKIISDANELTKDVMPTIESYIKDIDEKDTYLF